MVEIIVTTLEDIVDANDGQTSLREAIIQANSTAEADQITFSDGLVGSVKLVTNGAGPDELTISSDITINGDTDSDGVFDIEVEGVAEGRANQRVFVVTEGDVRFESLKIERGVATYGDGNARNGGNLAVYAGATATVINSQIAYGFGRTGGNIYNAGTLTIANSSVTSGFATSYAGGGIFNTGDLTLVNATIAGNNAGLFGGGVASTGGSLTILNSTVTGNTANMAGGIYATSGGSVNNSIILGNTSTSSGPDDFNSLSVQRGASSIFLQGNTVNILGAGVDSAFGPDYTTPGVFSGSVADTTYSRILTDVFDTSGLTGIVISTGGASLVAPLAENSPALNQPSSAYTRTDFYSRDIADIDGDGNVSEFLPTDALGADRRVYSNGDSLGAMTPTRSITVTTLKDEDFGGGTLAEEAADGRGLSLREAIGVGAAVGGAPIIGFAPISQLDGASSSSLPQEINLTGGVLSIDSFVRIDGSLGGNQITISGQGASGIFDITSNAQLASLRLTDGYAVSGGGAIKTSGSNVFITDVQIDSSKSYGITGFGGAIYATGGNLMLNTSKLLLNNANYGGALLVANDANVTINQTLIGQNNAVQFGGSAAIDSLSGFSGQVAITSSTIAGNTSTGTAAVDLINEATFANSIIAGNENGDVTFGTLGATFQGGNLIGGSLSVDGVEQQTIALDQVFQDIGASGLPEVANAQINIAFKSPTLDAGDASLLSGGVRNDLNGNPRQVEFQPGGGILDLGATELQRQDQPAIITSQIPVFGENSGGSNGTPVSITDPDAEDTPSIAGIVVSGAFGAFAVSPDGTTFSYTLNANAPDLAAGQTRDDTAEITATDGTTATLTSRVVGEDAPVDPGDPVDPPVPEVPETPLDTLAVITSSVAELLESDGASGPTAVSIVDPDPGDNPSIAGQTALGQFGVFNIAADGLSFTYTLLANAPDLASGVVRQDSATITATDGTTAVLIANTTGEEVITGATDGDDTLIGTVMNDRIDALGGNDVVTGLSGDDLLFGRGGDDVIRGSAGNDSLRGNGGDDTLRGNGGEDNIKGNGGVDLIRGNGGADVIRAGGGADNARGGGGADLIFGGGGADDIRGGGGADTLRGNGGDDTLTGNGGADVFQFRTNDRNDTIADFRQGQDMIEILNGARSFEALRIEQDGQDVLIGFGVAGQVRVVTDNAAAFDADDFIF